MERIYLSLKTIYKMLMSNDYPVYSDSVIPEKMRKGQTLLRFWQGMIAEEFSTGLCGRTVWKNDGKRNRYLSGLCNRTGEYRLYREYAREIAAQCTVGTLLMQIRRFSEFLSVREYRYDILLRRVMEIARICETEDRVIPEELLRKIRAYAVATAAPGDGDIQGRLFQAGYLLTLMTVYACCGDSMDEPGLSVMLSDRLSLEALWEATECSPDGGASVEYMTVRSGILQDHTLPRRRFFGREEALFDIRELAAAQRKCLISGIGGIGKTELLRQILRLCEEERLADKLAVVPYGSGLAESFVRSFAERKQLETEEAFRSILSELQRDIQAGVRVLLLIDDLDRGVEEDPDLKELGKLSCGILVTSRRTGLEGFETYHLGPPSFTTGTLIFRDNYGRPLTREDREVLKQMLRSEDICHPLTLNLMARAAGSRAWSVSQLMQHLETEGTDLTWVEEDRVLRTSRIYNQLYSLMRVPEDYRQIAELFTMLPSDSYSEAFLLETFPSFVGDAPGEKLQRLAEGGWLECLSDGYAMHPLVAECLRRKVITEERYGLMLTCLRRRLPPPRLVRYEMELPPEDRVRIARILLYMAGLLTGGISSALMLDLLNAANLQSLTRVGQQTVCHQLSQWRKRCRDWSDILHVTYCVVLAWWDMVQVEDCETVYASQKTCLTVPKALFLDFCLRAGQSMTYAHQAQLSLDMLTEVLNRETRPTHKAMAYYNLSGHCHILGSAEKAMEWSEKGVAYVREHPECGKLARLNNLHMLCNMYMKYRKQEDALSLLQEMEQLLEGNTRPDLRSEYLSILGLYEMTFGDPEKALECMLEQLAINREFFGMGRDYYLTVSMLGNTCIRLNRLEEAVEHYEEAIAYAGEIGDRNLLQSASNNISVALMKMDRPKDALAHLETAVAEGRRIGGLMFGESLRNTALAWGMLGNEEKELAYFEEAWPLLLEAYGPDHPRAEVAWKRMEELKNKK